VTASGAAPSGNRTTIPERSTTSAIGSATTRTARTMMAMTRLTPRPCFAASGRSLSG
jgi:hypothetical protein